KRGDLVCACEDDIDAARVELCVGVPGTPELGVNGRRKLDRRSDAGTFDRPSRACNEAAYLEDYRRRSVGVFVGAKRKLEGAPGEIRFADQAKWGILWMLSDRASTVKAQKGGELQVLRANQANGGIGVGQRQQYGQTGWVSTADTR